MLCDSEYNTTSDDRNRSASSFRRKVTISPVKERAEKKFSAVEDIADLGEQARSIFWGESLNIPTFPFVL